MLPRSDSKYEITGMEIDVKCMISLCKQKLKMCSMKKYILQTLCSYKTTNKVIGTVVQIV